MSGRAAISREMPLMQAMLRGGPMMKMPGNWHWRAGFSTDYRKKLTFEFFTNFGRWI